MKPKTFLISFHKLGTRSFNEFMQKHGFSTIHYPRNVNGRDFESEIEPFRDDPAMVVRYLAPVIEEADSHSDVPWPGLFPELMKAYPDARFVLGIRDPEEWADSVAHHWSLDYVGRNLGNYEYCQYRPYLGGRAKEPFTKSDRPILIKALMAHNAEATRLIPADRLFTYNLGEVGVGAHLGDFLGFKTSREMPHTGQQKKTQLQRLKTNLRKRFKVLNRLMPRH